MAKCEFCGNDMLKVNGCVRVPVVCDHRNFEPIKCGDPGDCGYGVEGYVCHDCGATPGHYHHPGCGTERCPVCGNQLISCGCAVEFTFEVEEERDSDDD